MIIERLRERRIVQFLVTYAAAGWVFLQLVDQVVDRSVLPEVVYRVALTLFLCGLPGAVIVSWFHGARGHQKAPLVEKWLLAGVGVLAVAASVTVARANMTSGAAEAEPLDPSRDPSRVAVLYFDSRGGGEEAKFLAAGLTESLIDELATVDALHVVSRSGSRIFQGSAAGADSIGRALEVGTLVNGSVEVAGERVRVNVSIAAAAGGAQLGSVRFERPRAELFDLQDELSSGVVDFLRQSIGEELGAMRLRRSTRSVEAWELFQKGSAFEADAMDLLAHGDVDGATAELMRGDSVLAMAEEVAPDWVAPTVQRGWLAYRRTRLAGSDRSLADRRIREGMGHAERALERDGEDPGALELKGTLLYWRYLVNLAGTPDEADDAFHEAERLLRASTRANERQASALTSLSHLLLNKGDLPGAKLAAQRSYEADPFLENANLTLWRLARSSWDMGDEVEARRWCDEGLKRFADDFRFHQCQLMLFSLPRVAPDLSAAWHRFEEFVSLSPPQSRELHEKQGLQYVAMALTRAGLADSARAVALRGRAQADVDPVRDLALLESITRSWLGEFDEAVRLVSLYLAANPSLVEAYRESAEVGELSWYHRELLEHPGFRSLLGVN